MQERGKSEPRASQERDEVDPVAGDKQERHKSEAKRRRGQRTEVGGEPVIKVCPPPAVPENVKTFEKL